ncbi:hypothetical protein BST61_g11360 [Cercospora zeina]
MKAQHRGLIKRVELDPLARDYHIGSGIFHPGDRSERDVPLESDIALQCAEVLRKIHGLVDVLPGVLAVSIMKQPYWPRDLANSKIVYTSTPIRTLLQHWQEIGWNQGSWLQEWLEEHE